MSPTRRNPYTAVYKQWGWNIPKLDDDIPFSPQPPIQDTARLASFFSGRAAEVERARDILFDGNNVMVRGQYGVGKSSFILTILQRLYDDYSADVQILPLYVCDFDGDASDKLYSRVLQALAQGLAKHDKHANEIHRYLTGERVSITRGRRGAAGVSLQIVDGRSEISTSETREFAEIKFPKQQIDDLLKTARDRGIRVFIALDDLDKQRNQAAVWQMLNDGKALLRNAPCKFILTGRPMIAGLQDFSAQSLELFDETFYLAPLDRVALKQAAHGQLNLIRRNPRDDVTPFTDETIERIITLSMGIPRVFNRICRHAVLSARREQWATISLDQFEREFLPEFLTRHIIQIPLDMQRIVNFLRVRSGISLTNEDDVNGLLDALNLETLGEAMPYLNDLAERDLIVLQMDAGKMRLGLSPLTQLGAEVGKS